MSEIKTLKTAELRKLATEKGIVDADSMNRKELMAALEALASDAPIADPAPKAEEAPSAPSIAPIIPKVMGAGIKEGHVPLGSRAERMKAALATQPRVNIMIPLEQGEKVGSTHPVTMNGYRLNIMKGIYIDVPQQVAEMVMDSQKQTRMAIDNAYKLDESGKSDAMRAKE